MRSSIGPARCRVACQVVAAAAIVAATFGLRAELPEWVRNVETAARWHDAIFRTVPTPAGPVEVRRSPADAHDALTKIAGAATDRELLALRARAAEEKLDPAAAEADWKAYASASPDAAAGQLALADFYHRRLLPQREGDALVVAARAPDPPADRLLPVSERAGVVNLRADLRARQRAAAARRVPAEA